MTAHTLLAALPDSLQPQVRSGRELARERAEPRDDPCPTGVAPLDRLLGGGLPVGKLIEMVGRRSSGRFSLVLAALATATTAGESVALIDLGAGKTIDTGNIKDPVVGFIFGAKGLMYNLTLEGSKISKLDKGEKPDEAVEEAE